MLERGCICHSDEVKPLSPLCRRVSEWLRLLRCFLPFCNAFGSLRVTNSKMQKGIFRLIFIMDPAMDNTFCPIEIYTIPWKCQYIIYKSYANFHKIKTVYYNQLFALHFTFNPDKLKFTTKYLSISSAFSLSYVTCKFESRNTALTRTIVVGSLLLHEY